VQALSNKDPSDRGLKADVSTTVCQILMGPVSIVSTSPRNWTNAATGGEVLVPYSCMAWSLLM
jgi:hypothetical protein